ncbi:MAG: hypothetical protein AAGA23_19555 [Pseudomonadota bacterium]
MNPLARSSIVALVLTLSLAGCAPYQPVRPYPDFIRSGVLPGDQVRVTRKSGAELRSRAVRVDQAELVTEAGVIPLSDITAIARRGWTAPVPACGDGRPLGCSIPVVVDVLTERLDDAKALFEPACVQHDFCYRHGAATYGWRREDCDQEFKQLMEAACRNQPVLEKINWVTNPASCRVLAGRMYQAVRDHGERRFKQDAGSYCEYDGPPTATSSAPTAASTDQNAQGR